jgi:hypothetical protein
MRFMILFYAGVVFVKMFFFTIFYSKTFHKIIHHRIFSVVCYFFFGTIRKKARDVIVRNQLAVVGKHVWMWLKSHTCVEKNALGLYFLHAVLRCFVSYFHVELLKPVFFQQFCLRLLFSLARERKKNQEI